jgi:hypothetical protein
MRAIDVSGLSYERIASMLRTSRKPMLLRNSLNASWWQARDAVLNAHGDVAVPATVTASEEFAWAPLIGKDDYRHILGGRQDVRRVTLNLSSYARAMHNGSFTRDTYSFADVDGTSLASAVPELSARTARIAPTPARSSRLWRSPRSNLPTRAMCDGRTSDSTNVACGRIVNSHMTSRAVSLGVACVDARQSTSGCCSCGTRHSTGAPTCATSCSAHRSYMEPYARVPTSRSA